MKQDDKPVHFRATREGKLTPRDCPRCGRFMDRAFLEERELNRRERIGGSAHSITREDVVKMRDMADRGFSHSQIAKCFGVSADTIRNRLK